MPRWHASIHNNANFHCRIFAAFFPGRDAIWFILFISEFISIIILASRQNSMLQMEKRLLAARIVNLLVDSN